MKAALLAAALVIGLAPQLHAQSPLTPSDIQAIVAAPDRSATDRATDERRKPELMLAFIGVRRGMTALDISASGGYTTELLARAIGSGGIVYGQAWPGRNGLPQGSAQGNVQGGAPKGAKGAATGAAAKGGGPKGGEPSGAADGPAGTSTPRVAGKSAESFARREHSMQNAGVRAAPLAVLARPYEAPAPLDLAAGAFDLVTLMFNYHDFGHMGVDRAAMNASVLAALKPGGLYIIADHAGRPDTGISESNTLHRIEKSFLIREVEAAGFKMAGEADYLRNPDDPRDRNVPYPPMNKDGFIVKFVKP